MHALIFSTDPDSTRAFFRDVMKLPHVDTGGGWLIFDAPAADFGVHPGDSPMQSMSFFCDDLEATVADLKSRGATFAGPSREEQWGYVAMLQIPGAGEMELYQPKYGKA
ncbi:MAG TPA: extradiol dioxygenase [Dehalococcoidia bacterium]